MNKLRKKIIITNAISACLVFLLAIAVIFGTGYARIDAERAARLDGMLDYDSWSDDLAEAYRGAAVIECDAKSGQIENESLNKEFDVPREQLTEIVQNAYGRSDGDGNLNNRVQYAKKTVGDTVRIVLFDRFSSASTLRAYVWYTLTAVLIGVLCYFAISLILAQIALNPIEFNWAQQKQFVADASHELKTPLSIIMANTEIIASHADETVESQMKWIENTRSESRRMAELVNDLLFLAKNDDGHKVQMEVVNLSECVETIVLNQESLFYENGKKFSYEILPNVHVFGNMGQLKQLATILLDNANKYSVGDGNICLEVVASGKHAALTVSNLCAPLTDQQIEHLFDRFYTVDASRNKSVTGNGLGLSIAQVICKTHRGNISADYSDGVVTFTVILPLSKK